LRVPVNVFSAVRQHAVHFQVEKSTGARIRYEKVSERSGKEVAGEDIQLGYELAKGKLVPVDQGQLEEIDAQSTKWDPRQYKDTYTNHVEQLIEDQAKGKQIVANSSTASSLCLAPSFIRLRPGHCSSLLKRPPVVTNLVAHPESNFDLARLGLTMPGAMTGALT
jgi:non-homologous end joining protein Ku